MRWIILLIIGAVLFITNPDEGKHIQEAKKEFKKSLGRNISSKTDNLLIAGIGTYWGSEIIDSIANVVITRKNYILFSTTNISFMGKDNVIGLGILGAVFISDEVGKRIDSLFIKSGTLFDDDNDNNNPNQNITKEEIEKNNTKNYIPELSDNPTAVFIDSASNPDLSGEEFNLDQEGDLFNYTQIGSQIWMKENLSVSHFNNGDIIPYAKSFDEWRFAADQGSPAWCYYNNNPSNGGIYGKLYNWYAVNDPRGLAPHGWHIPSRPEWVLLINTLGGEFNSYLKIRSQEIFNAINGGFFGINTGKFGKGPQETWTSTATDENLAYFIVINEATNKVSPFFEDRGEGMYVRCVKN